MASSKNVLSSREMRAVDLVVEWLNGEHEYQFEHNIRTHRSGPVQTRERILELEIPTTWQKFQYYRDLARVEKKASPRRPVNEKILMNVGQNALKCAAAARSAFVWAAVSNGMGFSDASEKSFEGLAGFAGGLKSGRIGLPWCGLLGETIQNAVNRYPGRDQDAYGKPAQTLVSITGLAISGVLEYQKGSLDLVFPKPGLATRALEKWQLPDPSETN